MKEKIMWNKLKSFFNPKALLKVALGAAQKPAETALVASLASAGITVPPLAAEAAVTALVAEIEKVL